MRVAVVAAAVSERSTWLAGTALQKEDEPARFGDLVRYWLAGSSGGIRPDRLVAAQQAATASGMPYGTLVHATLATAVAKFKSASAKADTAIARRLREVGRDRYCSSGLTTATSDVKTAEAEVTAAQGGGQDRDDK